VISDRDGGKMRQSRAQEARVAAGLGARLQPRSGAGWSAKNDASSEKWLIECKRTDNKSSITLKAKDLEGLRTNAARVGKSPVLQFDLNGRGYCVVREEDFEP
jgi:hypothetical protein